jgi:hypothetical protein
MLLQQTLYLLFNSNSLKSKTVRDPLVGSRIVRGTCGGGALIEKRCGTPLWGSVLFVGHVGAEPS